jgi:hypothetical protein
MTFRIYEIKHLSEIPLKFNLINTVQIHRVIWVLRLKLVGYVAFLITSKVLDVRRQGATTEAYGSIRRKEKRSKATPQMMP